MSRKKEYHEEHADETWLLPYSDLLTLLLALFIVMFAISSIDKEKLEKISEQFSIIFSGGSGMMEKEGNSVISMQNVNVPEEGGNNDSITNTNKITSKETEEDVMNEIKKKLENEIEKKGYKDRVKVILNNEGLEITLQDAVLFKSGDSQVIKSVYPLLMHISEMMKPLENSVRFVGHTDNVPIHTSEFRSNWDLSYYRALNVMYFMVDKGDLNPKAFKIEANGEFSPRYDNSTEEGRAKNRRVEIFVERKFPLDDNDKESKETAGTDETSEANKTNEVNKANEANKTSEANKINEVKKTSVEKSTKTYKLDVEN